MYSIAIDGPAGSGKSTVSKILAQRLSDLLEPTIYVDTGALYRAIAYFLIKNLSDNDIENQNIVSKAIEDIRIDIKYIDNFQHVYVNGEDVSEKIRETKVSEVTSKIARYPDVREHLLFLQRNMAKKNNVVMDGRDIGSVVLPDADLKIFLSASVDTRAKRRYEELRQKGYDVDIVNIRQEIKERDERDKNRSISPLVKTHDAVEIDTSNLNIDEVITKIMGYFRYV